MPSLADLLADPPARYRPQPLWVWNGQMTRQRITEMLEQGAAQGWGGVFIHPRPGLITEYLSEEWFDLWRFSLEECERLGMECHIYDENSFPSGFGGGHTFARNPHTIATVLVLVTHATPPPHRARSLAERLAVLKLVDGQPHRRPLAELEQASPDNVLLSLESHPVRPSLWSAGMPPVDLLLPQTTQTFLSVTHQAYHDRLGEAFGKTLRFAFADEPKAFVNGINASIYLRQQFQADHGYPLEGHLEALFFDVEGAQAVRFDYLKTVNRLFCHNYARACHDWCEAHGIAFTGHYHETPWPATSYQPSTMAALRWMHAPGNDLLGFQFKPTSLADNAMYFLQLRELDSVKRQLGRETSLTESTGGGGYAFTLRDFKANEDFLLTQGVNLINPHLSHQSLAGARKYDWAHTVSDHAPWWPHYHRQAHHVASANAILSQGREDHRLLVLHPVTTSWIHFRAHGPHAERTRQPFEQLRTAFENLLLRLYQAGFGYDLGDEFILDELARVSGGQLRLGPCAYDAILLPDCVENLCQATLELLERYLEAGGTLFLPTEHRVRSIDGRPSDAFSKLLVDYADSIHRVGSAEDLCASLATRVTPTLTGAGHTPLPENLCWRCVHLDGGQRVWFFANPFDDPLQTDLQLDNASYTEVDTQTGRRRQTFQSGQVTLDLPARGHALLLPENEVSAIPPSRIDLSDTLIDLKPTGIRRLEDNCLVLDFCDLDAPATRQDAVPTIVADRENWRAHGFPQNLWCFSIQFRRTFLEAPIPPGSGFTATYRFDVNPEALDAVRASLRLAIERPHLYQLQLNGQSLDPAPGQRWFDEDIRALPIAAHLIPGTNTLTLTCRPFHVLAEIMPVYVLGDFTLTPQAKGFRIEAPRPLTLGHWQDQGLPFFPGALQYTFSFTLDQATSSLRVALTDFHASTAEVAVDAQPAEVIAYPPYEAFLQGDFAAGRHTLSLRLFGHLKNQLGPHFNSGLPGPWSWEHGSAPHLPPGNDYTLTPSGLTTSPILKA